MVIVRRHVDMIVPILADRLYTFTTPTLHLSQTIVAERNNRLRKQEKDDKSCRGCTQKSEQRDIVVKGSIQAQQRHIYTVL